MNTFEVKIAERFPLDVLYQDEHLVVVNKPSGLLVHRSEIDRRETQFLMQWVRDQIGQRVYPVHRLDKPTSGAIVLALDSDTARLLSEQFASHQVTKQYIAIVRGHVKEPQTIDHALKEELDKIADAKARKDKPAQDAITQMTPLAKAELPFAVGKYATARYSLVSMTPETGRKHQLRRHMAHIRHPILVDSNHGDNKHNRFFREQLQINRLMLHAQTLQFTQPHTKQLVHCKASFDSSWRQALEALDWLAFAD